MEVDCEGCAGCCIDWRPLAAGDIDHERRGPDEPLDDEYNLVPLHRDEVRGFLEEGLADALVARLFASDDAGDQRGQRELSLSAGDRRDQFTQNQSDWISLNVSSSSSVESSLS